ncbi:DNA polymerase zeta catalytic subunit, putative [Babesia caballi]|uniref:DNA polymerase zeta catalytic subunit n=1 Tax=Babesia caballi TaxID=5871 RepID=A0AAV4LUQ7_BABCB|nr:DNA polymerase zeta catalytic subunit, putative [Babesia caballi]
MWKPAEFDPQVSSTGARALEVPVIRVFGATPCGQQVCLHIHGYLPYFYLPVPDKISPSRFAQKVHRTLERVARKYAKDRQRLRRGRKPRGVPPRADDTNNPKPVSGDQSRPSGNTYESLSDGKTGAATRLSNSAGSQLLSQSAHRIALLRRKRAVTAAYIHRVDVVEHVVFYGYHTQPRKFLKVYHYHPSLTKVLAGYACKTGIAKHRLQPYEVHVSYLMHFMSDYNIKGMDYIYLSSAIKMRRPLPLLPRSSVQPHTLWQRVVLAAGQLATDTLPMIERPVLRDSPSVFLSEHRRRSSCELEIDTHISSILNVFEYRCRVANDTQEQSQRDFAVGQYMGTRGAFFDQWNQQCSHLQSASLSPFDAAEEAVTTYASGDTLRQFYGYLLQQSRSISGPTRSTVVATLERLIDRCGKVGPSQRRVGKRSEVVETVTVSSTLFHTRQSYDPAEPRQPLYAYRFTLRPPQIACDTSGASQGKDVKGLSTKVLPRGDTQDELRSAPSIDEYHTGITGNAESSPDGEPPKPNAALSANPAGMDSPIDLEPASEIVDTPDNFESGIVLDVITDIAMNRVHPDPETDAINAVVYTMRDHRLAAHFGRLGIPYADVQGAIIVDPLGVERPAPKRVNIEEFRRMAFIQRRDVRMDDVERRVFSEKYADVSFVASEKELIERVRSLILGLDPNILYGYDMARSSIGYINQRAALLGDPGFLESVSRVPPKLRHHSVATTDKETDMSTLLTHQRSKLKKSHSSDSAIQPLFCAGRLIFDLADVAVRELNLSNLSLENIVYDQFAYVMPSFNMFTLNKWLTTKVPVEREDHVKAGSATDTSTAVHPGPIAANDRGNSVTFSNEHSSPKTPNVQGTTTRAAAELRRASHLGQAAVLPAVHNVRQALRPRPEEHHRPRQPVPRGERADPLHKVVQLRAAVPDPAPGPPAAPLGGDPHRDAAAQRVPPGARRGAGLPVPVLLHHHSVQHLLQHLPRSSNRTFPILDIDEASQEHMAGKSSVKLGVVTYHPEENLFQDVLAKHADATVSKGKTHSSSRSHPQPASTLGIHVMPNGVMFVDKSIREGMLPMMLKSVLQSRRKIKAAMARPGVEPRLLRKWDREQYGLKMLSNLSVGLTASGYSGRMPCSDLAESVVSVARALILFCTELVHDSFDAQVIYGDTDSIFIKFPGRTVAEAHALAADIATAINNAIPEPIKIVPQKVYSPCLLVSKKRYLGLVHDKGGVIFDDKGVETMRTSECDATRQIIRGALESILRTKSLDAAHEELLRVFRNVTLTYTPKDFILYRQVRLGTYREELTGQVGTLPAAAIVAKHKLGKHYGRRILENEYIPHVFSTFRGGAYRGVKGGAVYPNEVNGIFKATDYVRERGPRTLPVNSMPCVLEQVRRGQPLQQVDVEYYLKKQVLAPLRRMVRLLDVEPEFPVAEVVLGALDATQQRGHERLHRVRDPGEGNRGMWEYMGPLVRCTGCGTACKIVLYDGTRPPPDGDGLDTPATNRFSHALQPARRALTPLQSNVLSFEDPVRGPTRIVICKQCRQRPKHTLLAAVTELNLLEDKLRAVHSICLSCTGSAVSSASCQNAWHCEGQNEGLHAPRELLAAGEARVARDQDQGNVEALGGHPLDELAAVVSNEEDAVHRLADDEVGDGVAGGVEGRVLLLKRQSVAVVAGHEAVDADDVAGKQPVDDGADVVDQQAVLHDLRHGEVRVVLHVVHDAALHVDGLAGVLAHGGLGGKHHSVRTVVDGVGTVGGLSPGGHGVVPHALQHLRGDDDGLAVHQPAELHEPLLDDGQVGQVSLHTEVATGNHERVGHLEDAVDVVEGRLLLDLRNEANADVAGAGDGGQERFLVGEEALVVVLLEDLLDLLVLSLLGDIVELHGAQALAQRTGEGARLEVQNDVFDVKEVLHLLHEADAEEVQPGGVGENGVLDVLGAEELHGDGNVGDGQTLAAGEHAVVEHDGLDRRRRGVHLNHAHVEVSVIQGDDVAHAQAAEDVGEVELDAGLPTLDIVGVEGELVALLQLHELGLGAGGVNALGVHVGHELANAQLGPLDVAEKGARALDEVARGCLVVVAGELELPDQASALQLGNARAVGEVQPEHVGSRIHDALQRP